ncbi:glycoside hydrolase family 3 N-terminal domain-containing protein [Flavobacterium sp. PL002]|uniref:glycoside hydrolase family 3 N-terminal domain-containing protein n=1 Tax=Flavobacterium sp. PL002 TaxID=1897058 RepID=UPI001788714F|nr:glycoside hydrolase family 3 N-terminal domain-containing protein [Flavobacterium sp. PL002]MBE0393473.1 Beta-hexosaminidase [Flavobacterium sp. PL002]
MKNKDIRILFLYVLFFFVASCATQKKDKAIVKLIHTPTTIAPVVEDFVIDNSLDDVTIQEPINLFSDRKIWVDSVYNNMTFDEKLGQLFMVAAYSNKGTPHNYAIESLIANQKIGGLIFFQGGPVRQANLTNNYQSKSKIPLFIGNDAEWGLSMRLDSTYTYPWNMTLGAIQDMKLIEKLGNQMGAQSKRLGLQFNFGPVLDINTNPKNPIIGFRSFGEDKYNVAKRAVALMKGLQNQNIFATGKHFPGHGDTETDSHKGLPTVNFSKERLEDVEFYPYREMFKHGLSSVMVAHLNVPSLESRSNYPSSISYNVVTNILKKELGFKGLIFTDALNMKAASNYKKPGEIDLDAFLAGNDILLFPEDVPLGIQTLAKAYEENLFTEKRLEYSVKKILKYKYFAGLNKFKPIETNNLVADLNDAKNDALQYELYENALTVLKNQEGILPIQNLEKQKIAYVKIGDASNTSFVNTLKKYAEVTEVSDSNLDSLQSKLNQYTTVIVGYHKLDSPWKSYRFDGNQLAKLDFIAKNNKTIVAVFANPYALLDVKDFSGIEGLVVSYQNSTIAQEVTAELVFGAIAAKGKLPVSINEDFKTNDGLATTKLNILGFTAPGNVGMNPKILDKIEAVAKKAIDGKMTPGMQILVARKGKVIYQKAFGNFTYGVSPMVADTTMYDVASLTKILSTLPNAMLAYDKKQINMETTLGEMLPIFKSTDKQDIPFKDLLSHYARLKAWVPFYKATIDSKGNPLSAYYRKTTEENFTTKVADDLFLRNDYHDTIMKIIADSKLMPVKKYRYSDFTFIILKEYLEKLTGESLDSLSRTNFFKPLGANYTMYNPLQRKSKNGIAPTEIDTYYRHQLLQGYVHDMGAAMEGGVGGHAGIFSNSMDVAKMMQLFLQKGNYGGRQYFSEKTFDDFNTCYFCAEGNRRGVGFDKPQLGASGPTCGCASMTSFGHTGFTGTMAWADPETEIVYVFLSNRTYPDAGPNKLSRENIREDIQEIIYEAIQY